MRHVALYLWRFHWWRWVVLELAVRRVDTEWLERNTPVLLDLRAWYLRQGDYASAREVSRRARELGWTACEVSRLLREQGRDPS